MTATDSKRTARCGCGALTATVSGDPVTVYVCACLCCQRKSGSAFTYAAVFPSAAVTIAGERKAWRHIGDSGRWIESMFCPTCGISVGFQSEGMPGMTGVSVGCFADPGFVPPARLYWASRRHTWIALPEGVDVQDTQDG
ncbi:MAG: aldehyde-activating protein [Rhizobiales bacterium]|nr:aldehyde-activating protein [Hyphomicrobiales bacterium]